MSTITLYKDKVNNMGSLLHNMIKSVNNLDVQHDTLKTTLQGVESSSCDLEETLDSISASPKSQKAKIEDLKKLNEKVTELVVIAVKRDLAAKDKINKAKEDFYTRYSRLKPKSEKSPVEKNVDDWEELTALNEWTFVYKY